ncbi:hypothetical protein GGF31_001284 [Allomyces arbusculus]|nr:hypothetical protein GGF31_001284 [Allomyces arbusculus]
MPEFQYFAGVKGEYTIETNTTGHPVLAWRCGNDNDAESPMMHFWVKKPNPFTIKTMGLAAHVSTRAAPGTQIAHTMGVWRPENIKEPSNFYISGKTNDIVKHKVDITWKVTDEVSSRVLTKELLDCDLPRTPKLDSDCSALISVMQVEGPLTTYNGEAGTWYKELAKALICPPSGDPISNRTRVMADALCRA